MCFLFTHKIVHKKKCQNSCTLFDRENLCHSMPQICAMKHFYNHKVVLDSKFLSPIELIDGASLFAPNAVGIGASHGT